MENRNVKSTADFAFIRMMISGIIVFFGAMLYTPQSGIIRTLPLLLVFCALADAVYKSMMYTVGCSFVFSLCLMCLRGNSLVFSVLFSISGALLSLLSVYGVRLLRAGYKTPKQELKRRCTVRSIAVLIISFGVYMLLCGNIINAVIARNENHEYINKSYGESIERHYTAFDASSREYRTYVSFLHENEIVGEIEKCFISKTQDNVRDYYEEILMTQGKKQLKATLSLAVDMFEITNCGINFKKDEILKPADVFSDYENRTCYVVSLYHMVENESEFEKLYDECKIQLENIPFEEIIICAGNAQEVLYTATVTKDSSGNADFGEIRKFDEKYLEKYSVTEKTVLDYWYTR